MSLSVTAKVAAALGAHEDAGEAFQAARQVLIEAEEQDCLGPDSPDVQQALLLIHSLIRHVPNCDCEQEHPDGEVSSL